MKDVHVDDGDAADSVKTGKGRDFSELKNIKYNVEKDCIDRGANRVHEYRSLYTDVR